MSAPLTSSDVVRQLSELARQLDGNVRAMESAERQAIDARHDADLAYSKAFLKADGSVEHRKHTAVVETERLMHEAEISEAVVRHLRRNSDAIKTRIDVGRSYSSAIKAEMSLAGVGTP